MSRKSDFTPPTPDLASPCVRNCCLDEADICLGCGRSLAEILAWQKSDPEQRRAILERAQQRRQARRLR